MRTEYRHFVNSPYGEREVPIKPDNEKDIFWHEDGRYCSYFVHDDDYYELSDLLCCGDGEYDQWNIVSSSRRYGDPDKFCEVLGLERGTGSSWLLAKKQAEDRIQELKRLRDACDDPDEADAWQDDIDEEERDLEDIEYELKKANPYAVLLDVYSHGGTIYSLHNTQGAPFNCPWDAARGAAVWYPHKHLSEEFDKIEDEKERWARVMELAKAYVDDYNAATNGEIYGVIRVDYDEDGNMVEHDACWSYVGYEYAKQTAEEGGP